ncbi:MAG: FAD-binding protein [Deltaproteobacteria bacterium]|nr:FAD-binding protein [Deltaproteobacteria bacterium]
MNTLIKKKFHSIVGDDHFRDRPEDLISYSYDAFTVEAAPDLVLLPVSTTQISEILKLASEHRIPVTARGAGSSICGAPVPIHGGIVLSMTMMNKILETNTADRYCIVEPGVINGDLQVELAKTGFFYPPDPGSMAFSTIGGNLAQNAGGPRCLKYGVTSDYVLGMEVVLASGEVIRFGSRNVKDVTGYRLSGLFCGSEGTLGIVTEITLKVLPQPEAYRTVLAVFNNLDDSAATVSDIIGAGILPAALELLDKVLINVVEDANNIGLPRGAEGLLLIEVDGSEEQVEKELALITGKARNNNAVDIQQARTPAEREALWRARRSLYSCMARLKPNCIVEDATVPASKLPEMIRGIRAIINKYGLLAGISAHAGDGNMHPLISCDMRDQEEMERVDKAIEEIFKLAMACNGTLSGEHGIGIAKRKYLSMSIDEPTLNFMHTLKHAVDPHGILNPGKAI